MNLISKLLPPSNIVVDLEVSSKKRMFEQAGLIFENNQGVAIPHGRIKGLREAVAAFVRLGTPVPFDAPDGRPVNLLFILLVPEQATEQHLQILSELAQMFSDRELREQLTQTQDAGGLHQLISSWQPDVTNQHSAAA